MEKGYRDFPGILRECMGHLSQIEFAERIGISHITVNRLLKGAHPGVSTLKKIAEEYPEITSEEELLSACGYISDPASYRKGLSFAERAEKNACDMEQGLSEMTKNVRTYASVKEFLKEYEMLYSKEDLTRLNISKKEEYDGEGRGGAEYFCVVRSYFGGRERECETWMVVFFVETKGGQVVVTDVAMDGASLMDAGCVHQSVIDSLYEDGEDVNALRHLYLIGKPARKLSAEEKLLRAIFGSGETYRYPVLGFGFYTAREPEGLAEFIGAHKEAFCRSDEEEELFGRIEAGEPPAEVLAGYRDENTYETGCPAAVAGIMRRETGLPFSFWDDDSFEENEPCVMVIEEDLPCGIESMGKKELDDLKETVERYARELHVEKYGQCMFYETRELDALKTFRVQEKGENDG